MTFLLIVGFVSCISFTSTDQTQGSSPRLHIPKCMNVTIPIEHYNSEDRTLDSSIGGFDIGAISSVQFGSNNQTVTLCFPSSPQLLNCNIRKFRAEHYRVDNHVLRLENENFAADLGDYFIDQEEIAHVCTKVIKADRQIPRCNFITLEKGTYAELGNDTLYINATKSMLERATYTIDSEGRANACYPLAIQTLNCKQYYYTFHSRNYESMSHLKIGYKPHSNEEYGPAEYYNLKGSDLRVCLTSAFPPIEVAFGTVYYVFGQLSLICLCFTFIYQLVMRQSNLHDKCLACFNVTMMAFYLTKNLNFPGETCHSYFIMHYVLRMSSQIWLTLTAFDIWKSFSTLKTTPNRRIFKNNKMFIYYSIVGWGSPFLWYAFVVLTSHYYDIFAYEMTIDSPTCWFKTLWAFFAFYFGPQLILSALNVVFFILTIRAIHSEARKAQAARTNGRKQVVIVCIKLFIVMGISFIIEGIMLSIQHHIYFHEFYVSGAVKSTQGIAIFIVVICKREAVRAIRNHFAELKLKWDALTINCDMFNRKKSNPIYLVEENHLNLRSKQIARKCRTYILHDDTEGDTFSRNNNIINETRL